MTVPERLRHFGLSVDYRNPPQWARPWPELFAEMGDLVELAEGLGFEYVWLPEHHFSDDGYAPSPLVLAAALSQRTTRMRLAMAVAVLPLYHPVRMAEDCALADILSGRAVRARLRGRLAAGGVRRLRGRARASGPATPTRRSR